MIKGLDFLKSCVSKVILQVLRMISDCERGAYFPVGNAGLSVETPVKKNNFFFHISIPCRLGGYSLKY
jgi:hypothetical protein